MAPRWWKALSPRALVSFLDIDDDAANALRARLNAKERLRYWHCDIRDVAALQGTIATAAKTHDGRLDVYIGNAANDVRHKFDELTPEYWDNNVAINLRPQVFGAQAAAQAMTASASGGSIIMMGSVSWMRRRPASSATPPARPRSTASPARWRRAWRAEHPRQLRGARRHPHPRSKWRRSRHNSSRSFWTLRRSNFGLTPRTSPR